MSVVLKESAIGMELRIETAAEVGCGTCSDSEVPYRSMSMRLVRVTFFDAMSTVGNTLLGVSQVDNMTGVAVRTEKRLRLLLLQLLILQLLVIIDVVDGGIEHRRRACLNR